MNKAVGVPPQHFQFSCRDSLPIPAGVPLPSYFFQFSCRDSKEVAGDEVVFFYSLSILLQRFAYRERRSC